MSTYSELDTIPSLDNLYAPAPTDASRFLDGGHETGTNSTGTDHELVNVGQHATESPTDNSTQHAASDLTAAISGLHMSSSEYAMLKDLLAAISAMSAVVNTLKEQYAKLVAEVMEMERTLHKAKCDLELMKARVAHNRAVAADQQHRSARVPATPRLANAELYHPEEGVFQMDPLDEANIQRTKNDKRKPDIAEAEDIPQVTQEDVFNQLSHRMPKYLRELPPLLTAETAVIPPTTKTMTFTLDFIRSYLGGVEWSPGLFYIPPSHGHSVLPNRTFYLLDGTNQPYLPTNPAAHGAILTAFFNENPQEYDGDEAGAAYENVPLFICNSPYSKQISYPFQEELSNPPPPGREGKHLQPRYTYYGTYSQSRWSDKLDYDRIQEDVPASSKMHFAETLSEVGRPEWVTQALMKHFFPKPEYEGRLPKGGKMGGAAVAAETVTDHTATDDEEVLQKEVQRDVQAYTRQLEVWEKHARMKVGLLKKENILEAFEKEDASDPPGLRLWWEYLQCVGWDKQFYNTMVEKQLASASR